MFKIISTIILDNCQRFNLFKTDDSNKIDLSLRYCIGSKFCSLIQICLLYYTKDVIYIRQNCKYLIIKDFVTNIWDQYDHNLKLFDMFGPFILYSSPR